MIDISCALWQSQCDTQGSCFFYDTKNMSQNLLSISVVGKVFSSVFFLVALLLYKHSDEEEDENDSVSATYVEDDNKRNLKLALQNNNQNHLKANSIDTLTTDINDMSPTVSEKYFTKSEEAGIEDANTDMKRRSTDF